MSKMGVPESNAAWDDVTVLSKRGANKQTTIKSEAELNAARRAGAIVDTSKKFDAGGNKQHQITKSAAKLDRETEELHHDTLGLDVGRLIQQGRQAKEMTQKDLATKINEKPQIINEYEAGKAIPNNQILAKIERVLGMKLRGKEKGQPLGKKPGSGSKK